MKSYGIYGIIKNKVFRTGFLAVLASVSLSATPLFGTLSLSSAGASTIAVSGTMIDFGYAGPVSPGPPTQTSATNLHATDGGGFGQFTVTGASTGDFSSIVGGAVQVQNLDASTSPTGVPLNLINFVTFSPEKPGWSFTLTELFPGVFSSADCLTATGPGGVCTPVGSSFNLVNQFGNQVSVGLSFQGIATNEFGEHSAVHGTFETTLSGTSIAAINAAIISGQAIVSSAGATIILSGIGVPEPGTVFMLLSGLGLIAGAKLYRRRT